MWRQIGSLETAGTHQNGNFPQKYFNKSVRGGKYPEKICLCQVCLNYYPSTLLENLNLCVKGQMIYYRFQAINYFMHFSILPYSRSLQESELQPNRKDVSCHTNLAISNLATSSTRNGYSSSTASSKEQKLKKPTRGSSSSNCKRNITISGVDHIRERLLRLSCFLIWERLWTIECRRSAISAFHNYVDGKPVDQHPEVCSLVSGIFNNRPSLDICLCGVCNQ